jgi:hypothetical protein
MFGARQTKKTPTLAESNPMMRVAANHVRIRPAAYREHHRLAAAPRDSLSEGARETAAAADDG